MRLAAVVLGLVACASVPALAVDTFTPAVVFPASLATIEGRAIDILEIVPGMTVDEVKAAILAIGVQGNIDDRNTSLRAGSRGVAVQTAEFVKLVHATTQQGHIRVEFTGPAAGNQAVEVVRYATYEKVLTAPTVESVIQALSAKYGTPSGTDLADKAPSWSNSARLEWTYIRGEQVPCSSEWSRSVPSCPIVGGNYEPADLQRLASKAPDFDYWIKATVRPAQEDASRVSELTVELFDFARAHAAAQADSAAVMGELERVIALASKPAEAPAL